MQTLTVAPPEPGVEPHPLERVAVCYVGDDDLATSLLLDGAALGIDVRIAAPRAQWPADAVIARAEDLAAETGAQLLITSDAGHAVLGADYVIAGRWRSGVAPGASASDPSPYAVTEDFVTSSGRPGVVVLIEDTDHTVTIPPQRTAER